MKAVSFLERVRDRAGRPSGRDRAIVIGYKVGASAARLAPLWLTERAANLAGPLLARLMPTKAAIVRRHQARAQRWAADGNPDDLHRATAAAFSSYARYWLESFRLPALNESTLDRGIDVPAYHHVEEALERGNGVILALPHLGGWEWAGFWMATVNRLPITVVVEPLDPPELFQWFADFRERLGMRVVPLGPNAGREVLGALRRNEIVCLLCDRDLTSDGIEVTFETSEQPCRRARRCWHCDRALLCCRPPCTSAVGACIWARSGRPSMSRGTGACATTWLR